MRSFSIHARHSRMRAISAHVSSIWYLLWHRAEEHLALEYARYREVVRIQEAARRDLLRLGQEMGYQRALRDHGIIRAQSTPRLLLPAPQTPVIPAQATIRQRAALRHLQEVRAHVSGGASPAH